MDFSHRSYQSELLDRDDIPFEDIKRNMQELDFINQKLGGHAITLSGLRSLLKQVNSSGDHLYIVEIGCGEGNNLRVIKKFAEEKDLKTKLGGVDINEQCIRYARELGANEGIEFINSDYKAVSFPFTPDIIFCSLFCHHFTDEDVKEIFLWMKENSRLGFFINDLHRHPLAYYSIKWLTKIFSKSYLVKNDAPLSVLRGFRRKELISLSNAANLKTVNLEWKWAFRWLLIYAHGR